MLSVGIGAGSTAGAASTAPVRPNRAQAELCFLSFTFHTVFEAKVQFTTGDDAGAPEQITFVFDLILNNLQARIDAVQRANPGISVADCTTTPTNPGR